MKTGSKVLLGDSGAALLVAGSIAGTLAYLTAKEDVVNTFTMGKIDIDLTETKVNESFEPVTENTTDADGNPIYVKTDEGNEYRIVPGAEYVKDPTITVKADSEEAYVRMMVTIDKWGKMSEFTDLATMFKGLDSTVWKREATNTTDGTLVAEFRYVKSATVEGTDEDYDLDALFTTLVIPENLTTEDVEALEGFEIAVEGHAIQATGFEDADEAWAAFDKQEADAD
jgi:predicted ribosomally synthesized peptide with SipW-like signal peptide